MSDNVDCYGENARRNRNYGLRVGDLVRFDGLTKLGWEGTVVALGVMDNNSAYIWTGEHAEPVFVVAEWCEILEKVEDRIKPVL